MCDLSNPNSSEVHFPFFCISCIGFRPMKNRSVRKRTNVQRNNQLDEIHRLSCRGFSQREIARKMNLSQSQISRDLEAIARIISPQNATEKAKRRDMLLAEMRHGKRELWDAWDRSKQDKETSTKEKVLSEGHAGKRGKAANERTKASIRSEGRLPNRAYMSELNKIWEKEAKMLGMNEPEKHDILVEQVKFIEIVRPAPKPANPADQPYSPIPPIPPVPDESAAAQTPAGAATQPAESAPHPQDVGAPEMSNPKVPTGKLDFAKQRKSEVGLS